MHGKVYNRFKILLAQKEIEVGRRISYKDIKNATGIASSTLSSWANNKTERYDKETIGTLCEYFDCL